MYGYEATVDCRSLAECVKVLDEVVRRLTHPPVRPMLEAFGRIVHLRTVKNFLDSQAPDGTPWLPVHREGWKLGLAKPLILTGALMMGAAQATANPLFYSSGMSGGLLIDASSPWYGAKHLYGDGVRKRVWLGVTEEIVESIAGIADDMMLSWYTTGAIAP